MKFQYIIGAASSGKTKFVYNDIIEKAIKDDRKTIIIIVPEQFTLQTQKDLVTLHPNQGIMNIEVLSFQRLAYRIFEEVGQPKKNPLDDMGKSMVLKKVAEEVKDDLIYFNKTLNKDGFIDELKRMITELFQYEITKEDLLKYKSELSGNTVLSSKVEDLYTVYDAFLQFTNKNYITTEQTLDLLKCKIGISNIIKNSLIYIDGFYGFTPQQYGVIMSLAKVSEQINFSLTIDLREDLGKIVDETDLFYESKKTYNKLNEIALENNIKLLPAIKVENKQKNNTIVNHLGENIFRFPYRIKRQDLNDLVVFGGNNKFSEVEFVAREIISLVKHKGYRYGNIAVVTGALTEYESYIKRNFIQYKIPCFIDQKKEIMSHSLVEYIRSLVGICANGWTYESIFRYLKTGLRNIEINKIDNIENFVLAYGIRGYDNWVNKDWYENYKEVYCKSEYDDKILRQINHTRIEIINPLKNLSEKLSSFKSLNVQNITLEIYDFLIQMNIPHKIESFIEEFGNKTKIQEKNEYQQIWKLVMDLFNTMVEVLGDEVVTIKEYAQILDAGFEQCKMGLIPPGLDQIVVGDFERTRLPQIKALFIIGVNDGIIPSKSEEKGIFTDDERNVLGSIGKEMASTNKKKVFEEQFLIYNSLSKPSEKLYLTYAYTDQDGKALRQSVLIPRINKIIPNMVHITEEIDKKDNAYIKAPHPSFYHMIQEIRKWTKGESIDDHWLDLYKWFLNNEEWKERTTKTIEGLFYKNQEKRLSKKTIKKLYGDKIYSSVSRIEKFSMCPFSYFVEYGLKAKPRKVYEVKPPDVGMFFHMALERFSKILQEKNIGWDKLSLEKQNNLIEKTVDEISPLLGNAVFLSSNRNKYLTQRLVRVTKRAVGTLKDHINRGEFTPKEFELGFGEGEKLPSLKIDLSENKEINLTGKIDRVDILEDIDNAYVKIIDYKSGNTKFDIIEIYNGIQLQLIVYLDAVIELGEKLYNKKLIPAGVFYFKLDDPMISSLKELSQEQLETEILKELKMTGLVLSDAEVVKKIDKTINGYSKIIPVQLTKNGISEKSSVATQDMFRLLQSFVINKVKIIGNEILCGDIKISPYKHKNKQSCEICEYSSICLFDTKFEDNKYNIPRKMEKEEVWNSIKESGDFEGEDVVKGKKD